ncbi:MAG: hypothetical protein HYX29_06790 [Solirubrobacterales bacterium]|nr:hypothetical protein [Solirubrobacterales bacterium]
MEEIILLPTIVLLDFAIEAWFARIARSKGVFVPWTIAFTTAPPVCVNELLNRVENALRFGVAPLGVVAALAGVVLAVFGDLTTGAWLIIAGFFLISLRGIFVAACFAIAELRIDPREVRSA